MARMNVMLECMKRSMEQLASGQTVLMDRQTDLQSDVTNILKDISVRLDTIEELPVDHHLNSDYQPTIVVPRPATVAYPRQLPASEEARNTWPLRGFLDEAPAL